MHSACFKNERVHWGGEHRGAQGVQTLWPGNERKRDQNTWPGTRHALWKEQDKGEVFSMYSSPSEAAVQSHLQTVENNKCISCQHRHFREMSRISSWSIQFLFSEQEREPRVTSSNGCFKSNGAELLVSPSYLYRTLHKKWPVFLLQMRKRKKEVKVYTHASRTSQKWVLSTVPSSLC